MKRGQVSIEFITIFGFIFLMMIPLIIIFFDQSSAVKDAIASNHIRNLAVKIADKAETVYYLGEPSRTTFNAYLPESVISVNVTKRSVIVLYRTSKNSIQTIIASGNVNMTGNISIDPGVHHIEIKNIGDKVSVKDR
jgi:hypothetical protein